MSSGSPSVYLLWAVLASLFQGFLILHLWVYDRFACVKWDHGRQPGAFKRVMTYSYLAAVPLLLLFSVIFTVLKYKAGYIYIPALQTVMPAPMQLWDESNTRWVLPLYFILSFAWAFEIITHLEELTFWLFLLHQGPSKRNWFYSWEFRTWYLGSMVAFLGMPLTVLIRRSNLETCIAWIFLAGSSAGSFTTLCFIYVLARFPSFIRHVKSEGAEPDVVVRLTTFYQLNLLRVVFRVCFNLPLLVSGLDGVRGSHSIVMNFFWGDFLLMIGGIGCFVSSAITLLIFFPRSITQESGFHARAASAKAAISSSQLPNYHHQSPMSPKSPSIMMSGQSPIHGRYPYHDSHMSSFRFPDPASHPDHLRPDHPHFAEGEATPEYESDPEIDRPPSKSAPLDRRSPVTGAWEPHSLHHDSQQIHEQVVTVPPRWQDGDYPHERRISMQEDVASSPTSAVHPYVMTFTSPIDLLDLPDDSETPRAV